jgi:hypothetical protein
LLIETFFIIFAFFIDIVFQQAYCESTSSKAAVRLSVSMFNQSSESFILIPMNYENFYLNFLPSNADGFGENGWCSQSFYCLNIKMS